jgi:nucleotidyltransferase/DNA polymerase involved in DNA repair
MLSKLGSAAHKPNNQTIILPRHLPECLRKFKVGKIRGFGGKIK